MSTTTSQDVLKPVEPKLLTHSSTQTHKACNRRYYLAYILGLRPAHNSDALRLGGAFHIGLEELKANNGPEEAETVIRDLYAGADCPPWLEPIEFETELETAVAMVRGYHARYHADPICTYVAVEQSFSLPILNPETGYPTPNFSNAGKIDGIVRLPDGRLAVAEHKTTSDDITPGSSYWQRLLLDAQISRYFLAARDLGFDVETVVYDVVRKPSIRPKAVTKADRAWATSNANYHGLPLTSECPERETPKMYGARLAADMAERPEFYFARNEIPRLESDLVEFQRETWITQQQIRDSELKQRHWGASAWPRNTSSCTSPYPCPYLAICRGMTGDPTDSIPEGYRRVDVLHGELGETKEKR